MNRAQQRQLLRAIGWRGTKSKRQRRTLRPELRPYEEKAEDPRPEED
jgi:hypothetical protein